MLEQFAIRFSLSDEDRGFAATDVRRVEDSPERGDWFAAAPPGGCASN